MDASIFSCIARNNIILVEYSNSPIIKQTVLPSLETILKQISISSSKKYEQSIEGLVYSVIVVKGIAFCVVSANLQNNMAILNEVERNFFENIDVAVKARTCGVNELSSFYGEKLKEITKKFCNPSTRMDQLRNQVNDVRDIMTANVELVLARGERLEDLIDKSEDLEASSSQFKNHAKKIQRQMCCKNAKWTIIGVSTLIIAITILILVILYELNVFTTKSP